MTLSAHSTGSDVATLKERMTRCEKGVENAANQQDFSSVEQRLGACETAVGFPLP